jgi:D-alanyl-D-alanine carboxypeptidase (penicillin-binding protein 5/6)
MFLPLLLLLGSLGAEPLALTVHAESSIVINPDNGAVLYSKNPHTEQYPASITKIATALYALKLKKDTWLEPVTATQEALGTVTEEAKRKSSSIPSYRLVSGSSLMGIKKGEILTLKDALYGMLLQSGNDAANVIAEHCAGDISEFVKGMNEYVKSLGCKKTKFMNPHGLFHAEQKTTAYDMSLIMKEALKEPYFREIINTSTYVRPKTNKQEATTLVQTNRLLRPGPYYYPKTIGGKTGYLANAQNTFVVAAKEGDRTLVAVFMKTKERTDLWKDAIKVFETGFNQPKIERVFVKSGPQKYLFEDSRFEAPIKTYTLEDSALSYYPAEEPNVKGLIFWDQIEPPVFASQKVGELRIVDNKGKVLKATPLLAAEEVKSSWSHFFSGLKTPFVIFLIACFGGLVLLFFRTRR